MQLPKKDNLFQPLEGVGGLIFWFLMLKRFFDAGYSLTNYIKYVIALFGISTLDVKSTMALAIIYAVFCLAVGYAWYRFRLVEIDTELGNRFNWFVSDMRKSINGKPKND